MLKWKILKWKTFNLNFELFYSIFNGKKKVFSLFTAILFNKETTLRLNETSKLKINKNL